MSEENQTQSALPAPFPWQQAALKEWEKRGRRGIAKVATGSGKTVFALLCAESLLLETRIKIVVPTIALAKQWKSDIASFGISDRIGEWHGEKHSFGDFRFMIYVVDSARYSISTHILSDMRQGKPVLLICDECQHYGSDWNRKIFHFIGAPSFRDDLFYSLGLSATPNCANFDSVLRPCLGDIFFDYDLSAAEKDKLVNPYFLFQIAASFNARERAIYIDLSEKISDMSRQIINTYVVLRTLDGDELFQAIEKKASEGDELCEAYVRLIYKRSGLIRGANSRLECIADLVPSLPADKRIIIFSERIEQADALKEALTRRGITRVRIYHSEMDEATKKTALEDFRLGEARILLCCKALDEGLNVPDADVGIVLSSTKSDRQRIQRLGRVLRVAKGKEPARLYYVYIQGTNDLSAYLGRNLSASEVIDVTYYDGGFDCDEYFELADRLLKALQFPSDLSGRAKYREFRRCLDKGVIRGDYFLPPDYLRKKKEESLFAEEKNYYHAMALLSELRVEEKAKKS